MSKEGCQCFTCRHSDEPRVVSGYLQGYIDASDWFLNWAKSKNIPVGSISDDDLSGIVAQMKCNRDESGCLLSCLPDLEEKRSEFFIWWFVCVVWFVLNRTFEVKEQSDE